MIPVVARDRQLEKKNEDTDWIAAEIPREKFGCKPKGDREK